MNNNYVQTVKMSDEKSFEEYMKLDKEVLIVMLIECNKIINSYNPETYDYHNFTPKN